MHIVPSIPARTAHPDFRQISFGTVDRAGANYYLHTSGGRNTVLGAATGYASFEDAVTAARDLTAGNAPAAAVFDTGARFFLKDVVVGDTWDNSPNARGRYDGIGSHKERSIVFSRADVKALVDGNVLITNTKVGQAVPVNAG